MRIDRSRRTLRVLAVVAAASAALAACSSQGGAQNQAPAAGSGGGDTSGANLTIQMVTHEQAGDTFWDKIRAGAEDAAKAHGITLQYSNNENGPEQATLVQNAIDSKVSGLAVTLSNADAVIPVVQKAAEAGIPVVAFNQGIDDYTEAGAKMYFGSDEQLAGQTVGQRLAAETGGGKTLCIIQAQGSVALETRCAGCEEGLPEHGEPAGQRGRPAVGAADDPVEAGPGPVDHQHRHAGRADRAGRDAGPGGGGQHRPSSPRSTSTRRPRRRSRTARSCSRSTSSPTCRATWRSSRCG